MLINNNIGTLVNLYPNSTLRNAGRTARPQTSRSFKDEMALSTEAQTFSDMLKKLKQSAEVRADKVNEYSARLADGSYYVQADDIVASMLGLRH